MNQASIKQSILKYNSTVVNSTLKKWWNNQHHLQNFISFLNCN